jgi:Lon protease-like protein
VKSTIIPDWIPIFPLPQTVFFPKTYLPLHVFEPRYREMVRDAMTVHRHIGMVLLKEGWEQNYYGRPDIHPVGCAGRLVQVDPLPDGQYNIVLYGLQRFRVQEEDGSRSYRLARIELLEEGEDLPLPLREEITGILREYARLYGHAKRVERVLEAGLPDEPWLNVFASELDLTVEDRQFLLDAEGLKVRAKRFREILRFRILDRKAGTPIPPHDPPLSDLTGNP